VHRNAAAQIGQGEGRFAVASVSRTDQLEEYLVLRDRKKVSRAEHPAHGREIACEYPDFTDIRLCHVLAPLIRRREDALKGDAEGMVRNGCMLRCA
jgi:hypothetical protein